MNRTILGAMLLGVAACGGPERHSGGPGAPGTVSAMPVAFGPISQACMTSDRKARSRALCGCIQYAADQTLSSAEQRRAVAFYADPHRAQEIRQSDRAGDQRFWQAYRSYGERAEALCRLTPPD